MSIEEIKETLPDVPVQVYKGGPIRLFWCRGRQCPAAVLVDPTDTSYAIQVAWATVAHVLNTNGAVRV